MTYSAGNIILATDYNGFVSTTAGANINATWGTATSAGGYGAANIGTVAAAATVTATQWATLNSTITSMGNHQGTAITSRTSPVAGNLIQILANVNTDITNTYTNRFNAASSGTQYQTWSGNIAKLTTTGSGTAAWTITWTQNLVFANTTAANSFFNSGGLVKIQFNKSSTGTSTSDPEWNAFAANCGAIFMSATSTSKTIAGTTYTGTIKVGGSGTPTTIASGIGFYQLTGVAQTLFQQFDIGAAYTSNFIRIQALYSGSTITFTTLWSESGAGGTSGSAIAGGTDTVSPFTTFGTAPATLLTYFPPETANITNTWGTPTISSSIV
jgi:hypothetical protein